MPPDAAKRPASAPSRPSTASNRPYSTTTQPTSASTGKASVATKSASVATKAASVATKAASVATKAASVATKSASVATKSASVATKSASDSTNPVSNTSKPTSTSTEPVSNPTKPASGSSGPALATRLRRGIPPVFPSPIPEETVPESERAPELRRSGRAKKEKPPQPIPEHLKELNGQFGPILGLDRTDVVTSINLKTGLRDFHRSVFQMGSSAKSEKRTIHTYHELKHLGPHMKAAFIKKHGCLAQQLDLFALNDTPLMEFYDLVLKRKTTVRSLLGRKWSPVLAICELSLNRTPLVWNENHANRFWLTIGELLTEGSCGPGDSQYPLSSNPMEGDKVDYVFHLKDSIARVRSCFVLDIEVKPAVVTSRPTKGFLNAAVMDLPTSSDNAVVFDQVLDRDDMNRRDHLTYLPTTYAVAGNGYSGIFIGVDYEVDEGTGHLKFSKPNGPLIMKDIYYYRKNQEKNTFDKISFKKDLRVLPDGAYRMKPNTAPAHDKFTFMPLNEGHDLFVFMKNEIKTTCQNSCGYDATLIETS